MKNELHPLGVLTWNTHMGNALRDGGLDWLLDRTNPHFIVLNEIDHVDNVHQALRRMGRSADWNIISPHQHFERGLTFILARPKRFEVRWEAAPNIRFGSKHNRRRTSAVFHDKRTGRNVLLTGVHVDPLGKGFADANVRARHIHEEQVQEHADLHFTGGQNDPEAVRIAAGDWNEHLGERLQFAVGDPLGKRTATQRMARADLFQSRLPQKPAISKEVRLDEVYVNWGAPFVSVLKRRVLDPPFKSNDHHAVMTRLGIEAAPGAVAGHR